MSKSWLKQSDPVWHGTEEMTVLLVHSPSQAVVVAYNDHERASPVVIRIQDRNWYTIPESREWPGVERVVKQGDRFFDKDGYAVVVQYVWDGNVVVDTAEGIPVSTRGPRGDGYPAVIRRSRRGFFRLEEGVKWPE